MATFKCDLGPKRPIERETGCQEEETGSSSTTLSHLYGVAPFLVCFLLDTSCPPGEMATFPW